MHLHIFETSQLEGLTGRGGYHLGGPAEWNSGGVDQRSPSLGLEPVKTAALRTRGELVEEQRLLQELPLALDGALRRLQAWGSTGRQARHYPDSLGEVDTI
ncbi:unnamed protein product [Rangifer tarandus platyrhynchus]|uniref:Uncharacterized protein n=1 Tax=Rangifer tarandus platyrhynchus TaxID=3082113 RepID=A0ABN8Y5J4_RANTA|nr:unnamed protein product [Rangifer tarandus platyrhynchus]